MALRKTKIVCTIGPAVQDIKIIKQLLTNGMNIARFNFSHGDHQYHQEMMEMVREASRQTSIPVAFLLDTKGPEIRTGHIQDDGTIELITGRKIFLTTEDIEGTAEGISISYKNLPQEVSAGKHIYIADGTIDLEVERVEDEAIHCLIKQGGIIGSRKNVNVIGARTSLPAITDKDEADIVFGIEQRIDFIAASFVRRSADVLEVRKILDRCQSKIHLIAKIEDQEGLENIDEIINVSNGIMIARGDLGVQLPTEEIPLVQKRIIKKCHTANKPVITATQMLDSMIRNPRPTRAEASDVANAIFDGTDAVMLSAETASGKYPALAVQTMHKIAISVEQSSEYKEKMRAYIETFDVQENMATAIAKSACLLAGSINASAILTPTLRGNTPKLISKYRPQQTILAVTTTEEVQRNLLLYWGVSPIITDMASGSDAMMNNAIAIGLRKKYFHNHDRVVMVAGIPVRSPIMLNTIRVHVIATILGKGSKGIGKQCTGKIVKAKDFNEATRRIQKDGSEILLTKSLDARFTSLLPHLQGVILEEYMLLSSDDIQNLNPNLIVISGVSDALTLFETDLLVTMDGEEKLIYEGVVEKKPS
jgi:pyruvate kinase